MQITPSAVCDAVKTIRQKSPLIHNITNYVVMNYTANALLALGASPVMAHAEEEMEDMVNISGALVINIGTLSDHWIKAMFRAANEAGKRNIPVILDPVGAGATKYRTRITREFLETVPPTVIRGNASEILAILQDDAKTKGVDSTVSSSAAIRDAHRINLTYGSVVCISGEVDYIISSDHLIKVMNGHQMMSMVTGMGCTASALCGAFAAVNTSVTTAVSEAMSVMGMAGELAVTSATGPGSLQYRFLDALFTLSHEDIERLLKIEVLSWKDYIS
ncbi:MAG: hydroxyethylthiazole kinase [Deltaproteobacteria bacterium]|nr:hydroxyethylthiazole kinase [Deltaproteobacteria bacterium]